MVCYLYSMMSMSIMMNMEGTRSLMFMENGEETVIFRWDDVKLEMMKKFGSQNAMNSVRVCRFAIDL